MIVDIFLTGDHEGARTRSVLIVLFEGVQSLDVTGPLEVFSGAGHGYGVRTAAVGGRPIQTAGPYEVLANVPQAEVTFVSEQVGPIASEPGLDMALALTGHIAGEVAAQAIQLAIEYDPQPPYDTGSPDKAKPETVTQVRELLRR